MAKFISIHAPRVGCDYNGLRVWILVFLFQSTHPAWGATMGAISIYQFSQISIHAPRVGCDRGVICMPPAVSFISIHAPRVGCDKVLGWFPAPGTNFNPRTPRGVRRDETY